MDHRNLLFQDLIVKACVLDLLGHLAHAGHHAHHPFHAAHLDHLFKLHAQIVHVELTLGHAAHHALGLFGLDRFLRFLNKRYDIAHSKNAPCDTLWLKGFERIKLFAQAHEFDRLARDRAHGQGRATTPVAIHSRQHNAGNSDTLVKVLGRMHCVLTGQPVHDKQRFARVRDIAHGLNLRHQLIVDRKPTGRVEHIDIIATHAGLCLGAFGDLNGVLAPDNGQGIDANLRPKDGQLFHGRGPVHVKRCHQNPLAVAFRQPLGQLGRCCRLAATLKPDHQNGCGGAVDFQRARFALSAQGIDQSVMYDLDNLLAGRNRFRNSLAGGLFLHGLDEIAGNGQRDVGLKQCHAHFAQRGFDVFFGQGPLFCQPVKDTGEPFGKIFKQGAIILSEPLTNMPDVRSSGENPKACTCKRRSPPWAQRADGGRSRAYPMGPEG